MREDSFDFGHIIALIRKSVPTIHPEGYRFIFIFAAVTFIMGLFSTTLLWIGLILTGWCIFFFRDPERYPPDDEFAVISPADGVVQAISKEYPPKEIPNPDGERFTRVSIFLSVFDVHVNRVPISGVVETAHYHPGKFFSADLDKASDENERQAVEVITQQGHRVIFVQIAGLIARRIVCRIKEKQEVIAGERYGIIRFGSRMDVYLPDDIEPEVRIGQRAVGGETVIARLSRSKKT
jgi:phosphatidylserine decarboxylase